jgi:glycosyltransferase involved in cell wall biosynthesis
MPRRILVLTGEDPRTPGGVEHFVRELTRGLEERGFSTEVFHRNNAVPTWLKSPKTKVTRYIESNLLGYFLAREARKRMGADVAGVISNGDLGWCAPAPIAQDAKRIHIYHGTYRGQAEAIRPFISHRGYLYLKWWCSGVLERLGGRKRIVLCNSDQTREEVSRFFGHNGTVAWLPLDTAHFRPVDMQKCRMDLGIPRNAKVGIFVGNVSPMKNFSAVRGLISALPDIYWILAVRGEIPKDVETNSRILLRRDAKWEELPILYNAADFSVCPSFYEPFGYVVAESLACGTPVIATPGGASRAFLKTPPLDRLLISNPSSIDQFMSVANEVLRVPEFYRRKIEELVRPRLLELMSPETWWKRIAEICHLAGGSPEPLAANVHPRDTP